MHELEVKVPAAQPGSYRVAIGTGLLPGLWPQIKAAFGHRRPFVVTDANVVSAGHLDTLLGGRPAPQFVIDPPGEGSKNITTAVAIVEAMEKAYLGRDTLVVALGGGTVGDMAGFAAAIFKRGVPVVQIPTTTLAQADSAIGGKTGVDSSVSKNAFGAFWHPAAVYIDVAAVQTLDERQYRSGLVESVKHAMIADADYFEFIEQQMDALLARRTDVLETLARFNCTIKGRVIEADPDERNQRRMLNYGHTIGHAVESASNYRLLHGEAIAIGIIAAGRIEVEMGLSEPGRLERVTALLERLDAPTKLSADMDDKQLIDLLRHDKKAVDQWPRFVLLDRLGHVHCPDGQYAIDVGRSIVEKVLGAMANDR
ncbi:3-dehydroquinate synthase [Anaerobaca lacustris]|uniref:3-dehydroquinate synthase n=1 Tax=Anaerobaca lacustris TaxID=3044600 RepID=A0AAW6TZP5_9BACT|nr:3-dehydroquinate synthase [Sedimentisphaerales bacterium M17dextr]